MQFAPQSTLGCSAPGSLYTQAPFAGVQSAYTIPTGFQSGPGYMPATSLKQAPEIMMAPATQGVPAAYQTQVPILTTAPNYLEQAPAMTMMPSYQAQAPIMTVTPSYQAQAPTMTVTPSYQAQASAMTMMPNTVQAAAPGVFAQSAFSCSPVMTTAPVAPQVLQMAGVGYPVPFAAAPVAQQSVLKMEVGGWQICEDELGEFYVHAATGQQFDQPPQQLLQVLQMAQR